MEERPTLEAICLPCIFTAGSAVPDDDSISRPSHMPHLFSVNLRSFEVYKPVDYSNASLPQLHIDIS